MIKKLVLAVTLLLSASVSQAVGTIDINSADAVTIASEVKGIGPIKAKAIVKYREKNGPYNDVEELVRVTGIGEKTLRYIRPYITVGKKGATIE